MTQQDYLIFISIELVIFFVIVYLLIRANLVVNTLQKEINELQLYVPGAIREVRIDLIKLKESLYEQNCSDMIGPQEVGFIVGRIFTDIIMSKFKPIPFRKKFLLFSIFSNTWKLRKKFKATFLHILLKK